MREEYCEAAILGDSAAARSVIEQARRHGATCADIYIDVLAPSQIRLGELWHAGSLNIGQEHLATTITMEMMDFLRREMTPKASLGVRAVVTPVQGDLHTLGARMIADFLTMDGWDVDFFGNGLPANDLAEFARDRNADLVAMSSTLSEFLPNAKSAADAIRQLNPRRPKILLGGMAVLNLDGDVETIWSDAIARDVLEAVSQARRLVGLAKEKLTLEEQLALVGLRINQARKSRKMTQQALADASGLDRTYISLVEHGKQNLTIGAVLKIAHALETPIGDLLMPPSSTR